MVKTAIASGTLARPDACESCGRVPKRSDRHGLDAHHVTYSRPLDILWLCTSCHQRAHPRPPKPGSARGRAEAELRASPARSDALIALAASCTPQAAGRWRHGLEQAGVIEPIPAADRLAIPRTWRARPPRLAIEQGATTTAEVMALSGASYQAAWRALDRARARPDVRRRAVADAAAATDTLSVIKTPPKRVGRAHVVGDKPGAGYYLPPDEIELTCCVAEYTPTGWQHERSCALKRLAAR